ncbi:hypothetical protein ABZV91_05765 [Nocardia sp. NPDC004568]|uniref:hypothetical protein n=1 Tax=Nocardia sp. NPDC004568 TaxID=3154551 RepID=UPI0033BAE5D8
MPRDRHRRARRPGGRGAAAPRGRIDGGGDDIVLAQLMRHRLRREAVYFGIAVARGVRHDEDDLEYHRQRLAASHRLRPNPHHRPPGL